MSGMAVFRFEGEEVTSFGSITDSISVLLMFMKEYEGIQGKFETSL